MRRLPRHNTLLHARLQPSFLGMGAWMTSQMILVLIRKLSGSLRLLAFRHVIHACLYNQALADVRSFGAGIKCLYCIIVVFSTKHLDFDHEKSNKTTHICSI